MNEKSIIRVEKNKDNPYVMIDNRIFTDERISWEAKGLLGYLISRPDDWTVMVGDLVNRSTNGRDAVYNMIRELRIYGYVTREDERNEKGKIERVNYRVHETSCGMDMELYQEEQERKQKAREKRAAKKRVHGPLPENQETDKNASYPLPEKPYTVKPDTENTYITNTDSTNTDLTNNLKHDHDHDMGGNVPFLNEKEQTPPAADAEALRLVVETMLDYPKISPRVFADIARKHDREYIIGQARLISDHRDSIVSMSGAFITAIRDDWAATGVIPLFGNVGTGRNENRAQSAQKKHDPRYEAFYALYPDEDPDHKTEQKRASWDASDDELAAMGANIL